MKRLPTLGQLAGHPDEKVARNVEQALALLDEMEVAASELSPDLPVDEFQESLQMYFQQLPNKSADLARWGQILYHLSVVARTMDLATVSSFRRLGAGSFGTIFVSDTRGGVVLKQVKDPSTIVKLEGEYSALVKMYEVCNQSQESLSMKFELPEPHGFFDTYYSFARDQDIPPTLDKGLPPHALYIMQRVWPVSRSLSLKIQGLFFPERWRKGACPDFLARLYLGKPVAQSERFFNAENFKLDESRMEELGLPVTDIAEGMGLTLAAINFAAGYDGRDIEFVLSGKPANPLSKDPHFSCIDFNQVREHQNNCSVIESAIVDNDPYYPRPGSRYWEPFVGGYTRCAANISGMAAILADEVVQALTINPRFKHRTDSPSTD